MVWHGGEQAQDLARPGPEGGRIEDASARPPHPEEDCAADGYLRWGAGFLQDFADFCRNFCLIFGTRRHHFASIRWRILRLILHRFLFDFH